MSTWQEYVAVMTDPGHTLAEITFSLVVDFILIGVMYPVIKRWLANRFKQRDQEHGHTENTDTRIGEHDYTHVPKTCPVCDWDDCLVPNSLWDNVFECIRCGNRFVFKSWEYHGEPIE